MESKVILMPHPGCERLPARNSTYVPWPSGPKHARKFIRAWGDWTLSNGECGTSWLEFWAEYEGPTDCERVQTGEGLPRVVQIIDPEPGVPTLNTDPWVFQAGFIWSVCRHGALSFIDVRQGDLVLFGSTVRGEWLLDTVFVVDKRINGVAGAIGGVYDLLVLPTISRPFSPYLGRAYGDDVRTFSFSPAARSDGKHNPFRRPTITRFLSQLRKIRDGKLPSPNNAQALTACNAIGGVQGFWEELVREVESAGLVLGTTFRHPLFIESINIKSLAIPSNVGNGCTGSVANIPTRRCR